MIRTDDREGQEEPEGGRENFAHEKVHGHSWWYFYSMRDVLLRLQHSYVYTGYHVVMFIMCGALLVWILISLIKNDHQPPVWAFIIEICVTIMLFFDIGFRIAIHRSRYIKSVWNFVDLSVAALCIVSIILFFFHPSKVNDVADVILITLRHLVQILRMIAVVMHQVQQASTRPSDIVFELEPAPLELEEHQRLSLDEEEHRPSQSSIERSRLWDEIQSVQVETSS